jgi:hypothetical protein
MRRVLVTTAPITASTPRGAHVEHTDLRAISFHHVRFLGLELVDVEITDQIANVRSTASTSARWSRPSSFRRVPDRAKMT